MFESSAFPLSSAGAALSARRKNMTWQAVQDVVLDRIQNGIWREGELIPTESTLATELGCARATVNRAMQALAETGVIERRRKVGTRVAAHPRVQLVRSLLRRELEAAGHSYGYRLLSCTEVEPPQEVAQAMLLRSGEPLLFNRALFLANGAPYCCEERWTNSFAAPGMNADVLAEMSACEWLLGHVPLNRASLSIGVAVADIRFIAPALAIPEGQPVLRLERLEWLNNMPVSLSRRYFPPEHRLEAEM
ncbi:UTRA domain-containing protein [Paracoccus limosus]|uniref:UTRA domain-containing protein n=1 Tax=Paracoccus limosus TaxID=913252 RepID=A0A844H2L6_9RHOB|nr:GntR family transcriptional regulator [Paracoccus limosus]MTH34255.1 UTRA domain-containing protein [Paracoccus limosus]